MSRWMIDTNSFNPINQPMTRMQPIDGLETNVRTAEEKLIGDTRQKVKRRV
jgi:hypothetical protein